MTIDTLDRCAAALACDADPRIRWDELPEYLRNVWRRRAALVLRLGGATA